MTYEGSGHGVYGRDACVTAVTDAYLLTGRPPGAARQAAGATACPRIRAGSGDAPPPAPPRRSQP
ncbi:alpha/beta hydrolase [Phytohabitans aurantiacus]|uniref:alpha/beta hydrolase n=1 Tax=Phytohabitans aurantiacus TaxID=3016789 RepID=UPI00248FDD5E|nr:alpha/beta hydrolase [Phytohabitans aurantiacus]